MSRPDRHRTRVRPAAYPVLLRWRTCVSGSVLFVLGSQWQAGHARLLPVAAGALATGLSVAQAEILNDVADREVDRVGKPDRPIPSGAVTVRAALAGYAATCAGSVLLGFLVRPGLGAAMVGLALGSALYCLLLKSTVLAGNVLVAAMAGTPVLLGGYTAAAVVGSVLLGSLLVSAFMLAFELVKTATDVVGDRIAGLTTVGTAGGVRLTLWLSAAALLGAHAVAGALTRAASRGVVFGVLFLLLVSVPAVGGYATALAARGPGPDHAARLLHTLKQLWICGLLCLVVLV
ncbi:MAG TPA: UbiA family prenyltransferase [Mycobacteriales bacterium]|nr:UbiA family prenyltransferase [Mycobacteriales bacterium]